MTLTPLEHAILAEYHKAFGAQGFPAPDTIGVRSRENTGVGRFVELEASATNISERVCCTGSSIVEMEGVKHGLGFLLFMEDGRPDMLELHTYGDEWDGEERPWRLPTHGESAS